MWEVILEALLDTLKLVPFLFLAYMLIEFIEKFTANKIERFITSKWSVVIGSALGLVPQCGFSVVATDLFSKKMLTMGTLVAIYIATSDEAIPIMIAHPDKIATLLPLLVIKFVFALTLGFIIDLIYSKQKLEKLKNEEVQDDKIDEHHTGCCHHEIKEESNLKKYFLHPLLHTLKISAYILIVNLIFNIIIFYVTETALIKFLSNAAAFTPLLSAIVGIIPNCASSVIITELFISGGLTFAGLVTGLCVNSGIAMILLLRKNRPVKQSLLIIAIILISSILLGYGIMFII